MSLLVFSLTFLSLFFLLWQSARNESLSTTTIRSLLLVFFQIFVVTEVISLFRILNQSSIVAAYGVILLTTSYFIWNKSKNIRKDTSAISKNVHKAWQRVRKEPLLWVLLFLLLLLFVSGLLFPPNNWDAMTYHLARVGYWIQNQSVAFYPTHNFRQLFMGPLAEYAILHIFLIDQSERLAFTVQFFSALGSLVLLSLFSKEIFKLNVRGQLTTILVGLTIPMSLLQFSSTQNDYVASFFVLSALFFLFKKDNFFFFLGVSLAFLTKQSTIFFLLPMVIAWALPAYKSKNVRSVLLFGLIFLAINGVHFIRNYAYFRSAFGPRSSEYVVATMKPNSILLNGIKNASLHFQTPFIPVNQFIEKSIVGASKIMRVVTDDSSTTYLAEKYQLTPFVFDQDYAGGAIHTVLILLGLVSILKKNTLTKLQKKYLVIVLAGTVLILLLVRWQPWAARLHLTSFLLLSPIILIFILRHKKVAFPMGTLLFLYAILTIGYSSTQPLFSNKTLTYEEYSRFAKGPYLFDDFRSTHQYIEKKYPREVKIGIISNGDSWEYPLWYYLFASGKTFEYKPVFFAKTVRNDAEEFNPDIIVDLGRYQALVEDLYYNDRVYTLLSGRNNFQYFRIWERNL